jgi:hypothetical protein
MPSFEDGDTPVSTPQTPAEACMTTLTKVGADDLIAEERAAVTPPAETARALGSPYTVQHGRLGRVARPSTSPPSARPR